MSAQINPFKVSKIKKHKRYFQTQLESTVHEKCLNKMAISIGKCQSECIIPNEK